jgi:hypothetical protein
MRRKRRRLMLAAKLGGIFVVALVALVAVAALPALGEEQSAAEPADGKDGKDWEVIVAPYIWATRMEGTITSDGVETDVEMTFRDIFSDHIDVGFMGYAEVRYRRWRLMTNLLYGKLKFEDSLGPERLGVGPTTIQQGPLQLAIPRVETLVGPVETDIDVTEWMVELFLGYQVLSHPVADLFGEPDPDDLRRLDVDLYGGGRYFYLKSEITVEVPPIRIPGFTVSPSVPALPGLDLPGIHVPESVAFGGLKEDFEEIDEWVDLAVGARVGLDLTDRWAVMAMGDVGGFGIGSASTFTWHAVGTVNYSLTDRWTLVMGYRALNFDREQGDEEMDLTMHGPIIGATYRF